MSFCKNGISLLELVISLAILGVIAAFTVSTLLQNSISNISIKQTHMAKDVAWMLGSAYEKYRLENATVATTAVASTLLPYLNYVSVDTSSTLDSRPGRTSLTCNGTNQKCLKLHNGGTLILGDVNQQTSGSNAFGCQTSLCTISFIFDPDSVYSGSSNDSASKSLMINLYYDGHIRSRGTVNSGSLNQENINSGTTITPNSTYDPAWFTGFN